MKIVILDFFENLEKYSLYCDGFIIGVQNLSVNMSCFSFDEIEIIIEKCNTLNKKIFISINKNMHNSDLDFLYEKMKYFSNKKIDGVIFYDIAVVNINKKYDLGLNLIWNQEHMVTNYNTINYWYNNGILCSYLSSELSFDEIKSMVNNTNSLLMMNVFGYIPMFTSKRPLIKNYKEKFNLKSDSKIYYMEKENSFYPIINNELTTVYSGKILNLCNDYDKLVNLKINYFVFNPFKIDGNKFVEVLRLFDDSKNFDKINKMFDNNTDTGFMYKETIYKVRDKI